MTTWLKLTGSAQSKWQEQYAEMLKIHGVTTVEFPPQMFVEYLLDIRSKAQEMKKVNIELEAPNADNDSPRN